MAKRKEGECFNQSITGYLTFNRLDTKNILHDTISRGDFHGTYDLNGHWRNCCYWLDHQHALSETLSAKHYSCNYLSYIIESEGAEWIFPHSAPYFYFKLIHTLSREFAEED